MYSYRRTPLSVEVNKVMKMLLITLSSLLLGVSVYFFIHMSGNAEKGSLVHENQIKQKNLETENRLLKEQVLEAQSLERIHMSSEVDDMAPSKNEIYISPQGPVSRSEANRNNQLLD